MDGWTTGFLFGMKIVFRGELLNFGRVFPKQFFSALEMDLPRVKFGSRLRLLGLPWFARMLFFLKRTRVLVMNPHLPVTYIFGTRGSSYLIYWQLGAWFQIYRELEDQGNLARWFITFHQPGFPWNFFGGIHQLPFGGPRSCEVATICPDECSPWISQKTVGFPSSSAKNVMFEPTQKRGDILFGKPWSRDWTLSISFHPF